MGEITPVTKSRGPHSNALAYAKRALSTWVNINRVISGVSAAKFTNFLFNAQVIVRDNNFYRLSTSLLVPEIFAVKLENCSKSHRFLNVFCPPKF